MRQRQSLSQEEESIKIRVSRHLNRMDFISF
jgi:hypothetical protein